MIFWYYMYFFPHPFYYFCLWYFVYSRSSTAIVPAVVPDDVHASQSSQPADGALESSNRRQRRLVGLVHSGSWSPACVRLETGEPQRGRGEPFQVMFHLNYKSNTLPSCATSKCLLARHGPREQENKEDNWVEAHWGANNKKKETGLWRLYEWLNWSSVNR